MALGCFDDRLLRPDKAEIEKVLEGSGHLWLSLIQHVSVEYPPISEEWAFSGAQYGWSLRLIHKNRRVLYLIPQNGSFLVGIVLGEKAVEEANRSTLPGAVLKEINGARKYAEGRGIRLKVASPGDLKSVEDLAAVKMGRSAGHR